MGKYKSYTETVEVDVSLDDWEDEEIVEECKARGYLVDEEPDFTDIVHCWQRGQKHEALILLERLVPGLRGITDLTKIGA